MDQHNSSFNATFYLKVQNFAQDLWFQINEDHPLNNINIVETSLSGNQPITTMRNNKVKWIGVDDASIVEPPYPKDNPDYEVAFQPQRIRSFIIEYVPTDVSQTQAFLQQ